MHHFIHPLGTLDSFAMDLRLQLGQYTSAELAEIIVAAGNILHMRCLPPERDSPTNKIPSDQRSYSQCDDPWAEADKKQPGQCAQPDLEDPDAEDLHDPLTYPPEIWV